MVIGLCVVNDEVEETPHLKRSPTNHICHSRPGPLVPTFIPSERIDVLLLYITEMVNVSQQEGYVPQCQKKVAVTLLLKKPWLDPQNLKNYKTMSLSNLSYVSKLVAEFTQF